MDMGEAVEEGGRGMRGEEMGGGGEEEMGGC